MYNEFYGLTEKPFELLPDPRFLFLTASHREIIASLMEGIRKRKGFMSVIGEVGTGKTTLIRYLLGRLEAEEKVKTVLLFHPTITFRELLRNILLELEVEVVEVGKRALWSQFNGYLAQMAGRDETLVVVIDEAQGLSREVMGEVGMLPKQEVLQVVFVGQPEFEEKLDLQGLRQLKQRIGVRHRMGVFSEEESREYMDHRLRLVRSSSFERFSPGAISLICAYCRGIPRVINVVCDNALLRGYRLFRERIDVDIIREVIKDGEGRFPQKTFFSSMVTAVKEFGFITSRPHFLVSRAFLIVLSFLCLGGFILLIDRYFQPRPAKTWDIKSLKSPPVNSQPSLTPPSPQKMVEEISKSNTRPLPGEREPVSPELPKVVSQETAPLALMKEEDKLIEIVTIIKGHTIYSLTKEYYHRVNRTLMDLLLDSNPDIKDVHLILVDQKIKIPKITEESLIIKTAEGVYKMNAGTFQVSNPGKFYSNEQVLKGKKIEILSRNVSTQETWYRVVIGNFDSPDEALKMTRVLKERGLLPAFGGLPKIK